MSTGYILGIARGHNAGACLLKDGEVVFSIEEERLSRHKYDGGPLAAMMKVKEYTDKVDWIFVAHTQTLDDTAGQIDFTGDDMYTGLARKMGLINRHCDLRNHPQVVDLATSHHKLHAAIAFYRSGFKDAAAVVVDGAGACMTAQFQNQPVMLWETETIFDCSYPNTFKTLFKHQGTRGPVTVSYNPQMDATALGEEGTFASLITDTAGITKVYEAASVYCGFMEIEAGKTMGLSPYGKPNDKIPNIFRKDLGFPVSDRNVYVPTYPNGALINHQMLDNMFADFGDELSTLESRRDMAYAIQTQTQAQVLDLILTASAMSGKKQVVLSGGYGLNCVANYSYLDTLNEAGIELYVEPNSNDAGTAMGAALLGWYKVSESTDPRPRDIFLGPQYNYTESDIQEKVEQLKGSISEATDDDVVELMTNKNIVAIFQGRSENGPRALGNRSLMFDPTFKDGKDFVNLVKRREYFRPFAGSILKEDVHEWFDLKGMDETPHMMYAVNCKDGVEEKIPSIIHVDGTCRIQTVSEEDNPLYYKVIKAFKEKTGIPIIFNTSFNLGGAPLVETLDDALMTLADSDIEYLYLPEYNKLVNISNIKFV
jgi:carbamoyltransferase